MKKTNVEVSCNCMGFQFQGLLCSHSLKVMFNLGMHLHPRYVLLRWTKEANQGVKKYHSDVERYDMWYILCLYFTHFYILASTS